MHWPDLADARACAWSDDGGLLAVATASGVALWSLAPQVSLRWIGPHAAVDAVVFAGANIWSASDAVLCCHAIASGELVHSTPTIGTVEQISPAGRVWVGLEFGALRVGALDGSTEIRRLRRPEVIAGDDDEDWFMSEHEELFLTGAAASPDGRRIVVAYADGACDLIELAGETRSVLQAPGEPVVSAIAWGPGMVALAGEGQFALYDGPAWRRRRYPQRATALFERVTALVFSPRGTQIAVTSEYDAEDGTVEDLEFVRIDDIDARADRTHIQIRDLVQRRQIPSARAASFDPSGRVLAICKRHGGVSLWDSEARVFLGSLQLHADRSLALLVHEPRTVGEDGRIEIVGDLSRIGERAADPYPPWSESCRITSGRGALAERLTRLLGPRRR